MLDTWTLIAQLGKDGINALGALDQLNKTPPKTPPEPPARISSEGLPIISRKEIDGMTPSRTAEYFYDRVLSAAMHGGVKAERAWERLRNMPQHWRLLYTLCWLQAEVDNGGHEQFFDNGQRRFNDETEADLRFIGAGRFLELFREARRLYDNMPTDRADRIPQFKPLDNAFYKQKKSLYTLVGEYVLGHLADYIPE